MPFQFPSFVFVVLYGWVPNEIFLGVVMTYRTILITVRASTQQITELSENNYVVWTINTIQIVETLSMLRNFFYKTKGLTRLFFYVSKIAYGKRRTGHCTRGIFVRPSWEDDTAAYKDKSMMSYSNKFYIAFQTDI